MLFCQDRVAYLHDKFKMKSSAKEQMITCYLDSQDYSTLTDPKALTADRIRVRKALAKFAREGTVQFVFSAAAVSEGVAVSPDAVHLAERKAELLSDLCGTNALVSFDRLLYMEIAALAEQRDPPRDMLDPYGNWFPEIPFEETTDTPWQRVRQLAEDELNSMGLSRQQRRAEVRKLIKNGKPRGVFKSQLEKQNPKTFSMEIIKQFPMKPEYAEMMARYSLGRADEKEFTEALLGCLRDPHWMMKWFTTNHAISSPIADIVRRPGRELGELLRKLTDASICWASTLIESGIDCDPTGRRGEISRRWMEMQDGQLVGLVQSAANAKNLILESITSTDIDRHCPGISATVRTLYSSVWDNVAGARKEEPSDSQPVDALHAMYAPYVRVFRADRFMAPHVQKQVNRHGTIVVPRLAHLVEILEKEIQRAS